MLWYKTKVTVLPVILLCGIFVCSVYAQERQDAKIEAQQHYQAGENLSSQGSYQEAPSELEKAIELSKPPRIEFTEHMQEDTQKAIAPPVTPATQPLPKEKLTKKKKEEEETTALETLAAQEPIPEAEEAQYYLDIGDVLDISVFELPSKKEKLTEKKTEEEYYVDIGDVLDISVWQIPDLSRSEVIVRPDGKISFPLIGDIKAEGLTFTQLADIITEKLKLYLKTPQVSIMIRSFGKQAKLAPLSNLSRPEVIIMPDGNISFPLIGEIKTKDLTLAQLDSVMTEKLKAYVRNPEVTIMIRRFGEQANKVIVLGEISSPGVYKFSAPPTITEVVAAAGGYTKYAVLNSVVIVTGDVRTKPEIARANVAAVLRSGKLSENIVLKPNAIVYVPRSFIGKLNTFLEILQPAINEYMQTLDIRHMQTVIHRKGGI